MYQPARSQDSDRWRLEIASHAITTRPTAATIKRELQRNPAVKLDFDVVELLVKRPEVTDKLVCSPEEACSEKCEKQRSSHTS